MTTRFLDEEHREDQGEAGPVQPGLWSALKAVGAQWSAHRDTKTGAAIAYYSIFSLGPLIVVVISVAALAFSRQDVQKEVTAALQGLLGDKGAGAIDTMLKGAGTPGQGCSPASSDWQPSSMPRSAWSSN